jgi:predicted TIM-barrel fold metal-dependent hydrolase
MSRRRIDVHQHILPPAYLAWHGGKGIGAAGGRPFPEWSVAGALQVMDRHDIASAVLSVSAPGVHLDPSRRVSPEARTMARRVNEYAAEVARAHPARLGFFATLTLPDVDGALAEVAYAFDELGAAGVVLLANTHGHYLGEPENESLFAELSRRRAVVFVHPNELPGPSVAGIPPFAADFLLDTTRAGYQLVQRGVVRRYRDLKIILAHAGGFLPYASHRLTAVMAGDGHAPAEVLEDLGRFYFDTALSGSPAALPSLLAFAQPGHVLFGSDWPFAPAMAVGFFTGQLDAYPGLDTAGHAAVERDGAAALFPQFATASRQGERP